MTSRGLVGLVYLLLAGEVGAQQNLSFETLDEGSPVGWRIGAVGYTASIDTSNARDGARSLRMRYVGPGVPELEVYGIAAQTVEIARPSGAPIRLSGYVRTESIYEGYAALWLRVEGPNRYVFVAEEPVTGTTEWTRYEIAAPPSPGPVTITFGALFPGSGTAWFDAFRLQSPPDTR